MKTCSLIIGIKNRVSHFSQTYPSMITQLGVDYQIVLVDFFSSDGLSNILYDFLGKYKEIQSPYLKEIIYVRLTDDRPYNPRECKNLGAHYSNNEILAFSDADVFIGMNYLKELSPRAVKGESFFATRSQETKAGSPKRIVNYINYGNVLVDRQDFLDVNGFDESISFYGGDDDDFYHRLKLKGLREINPYDSLGACHYSILHGDDLRLRELKDKERRAPEKRFEEIYGNNDFKKSKCSFLNEYKDCNIECFRIS